ncbi:MAG: class GN sortase [Halioglobus sp.]
MPDAAVRVLFPVMVLLALQQLGSAGVIYAKAWLAPVMLERAWQQSMAAQGQPVKPWPWADTWPVAKLSVPSLNISQFVLAGDTGNSLAFGPGHNLASAELGASGSAMIGGHRDTHFAFLRDLRPGQRILLRLPTGALKQYRVQQTAVVDSSVGQPLWSSGHEQLLLVTCYPFDALMTGGPLRFVVFAEPEQERVVTASRGPGNQRLFF